MFVHQDEFIDSRELDLWKAAAEVLKNWRHDTNGEEQAIAALRTAVGAYPVRIGGRPINTMTSR